VEKVGFKVGGHFIMTFNTETLRRQIGLKPIKSRAMDTKTRGEVGS